MQGSEKKTCREKIAEPKEPGASESGQNSLPIEDIIQREVDNFAGRLTVLMSYARDYLSFISKLSERNSFNIMRRLNRVPEMRGNEVVLKVSFRSLLTEKTEEDG